MPFDFSKYSAVLLDLDGTVYFEDDALPGAIDLIKHLQAIKKPFACLSNSTSSPQRIAERIRHMGGDLDPSRIYTAAAAVCDYVLETFQFPGRKPRVMNLSTEAVNEMLEGKVDWVNRANEPCDAVISGAPSNVFATEDRQRAALVLLRQGTALVAICADRVYPSPRGIEFGSGAHALMLSYAANVTPVYCGKPEKLFFDELCHNLHLDPKTCILIGDNLEADVLGAKQVGMGTILTLTGVSRRSDLEHLTPEAKPDFVIEDLRKLL